MDTRKYTLDEMFDEVLDICLKTGQEPNLENLVSIAMYLKQMHLMNQTEAIDAN